MKVELTVSRAVQKPSGIVGQTRGQIVDVSEQEAKSLVEHGKAVYVDEPKKGK